MLRNTNKRVTRIRWKIRAGSDRARLAVFRSNKFLYAQVINDIDHKTIASAWGKAAEEVGQKIADRAVKAKTTQVVFDRGGYKYHGKIKLLAEAARKGGLKF